MKTNILAGLVALAATGALADTASAHLLTVDTKPAAAACVIATACRPLHADVPVYLWLVDGKKAGTEVAGETQRKIKDASLGLQHFAVA